MVRHSFNTRSEEAGLSRVSVLLALAVAALTLGGGAAAADVGDAVAGDQPSPAQAPDVQPAASGGGTTAPGEPRVSDVACVTKCIKTRKGIVGSRFRITGSDLQQIRVVSLPRSDGKRAKDTNPLVKPSGAVLAFAKTGAITGPVRVADSYGQIAHSPIDLKIGTTEQLKKAQSGWRFPVRGPHDYGGAMARFGAPRSGHTHQGHDVMASCGTKMVAARGGKVQYRGYQASGAGYYIVIDGAKTNLDFVYMHLMKPAAVAKGQTVATGQKIGKVGTTGSSSGCHLHFENWTGPGWYEGGKPFDPLKNLKYWDSFS
jgi:murein DD-endopeptidase MepM/ murein hydrolase activator NlpD